MSLPHASEILPALLAARDRAGHLLVGLDYDGTLTPIVPRPQDAELPSDARQALEHLVARADTAVAVLSGRGLADVRDRVRLPGIFYAGNHGLEIAGPAVEWLHPGAAAAVPALRAVARHLHRQLERFPGAEVEDKGLSLSVHFRRVAAADRATVRSLALQAGRERPGLRLTEGKMVVELRPDVDWHKGAALEFIRRSLTGGASAPAVFLGDDRTDEDAFRVLGDDGWGVLVASSPPPGTCARAFLAGPGETVAFLDALAAPYPQLG